MGRLVLILMATLTRPWLNFSPAPHAAFNTYSSTLERRAEPSSNDSHDWGYPLTGAQRRAGDGERRVAFVEQM
jgi:hypothetical protein